MKTIKPKVFAPFSDASIENAIWLLKNENTGHLVLVLVISVFDVTHAIGMMIDNRYFAEIHAVEVSRFLAAGDYQLVDKMNDVMVDGSDEI